MNISSDINIDIEKIISEQNKFNNIESIENSLKNNSITSEIKDKLYNKIIFIMNKYESNLHNYFKIKKKKEKKEILDNLINNIFNFVFDELNSDKELDIENFIKKLHLIIFPNGIWGETISPSGQTYYSKYESGKYRNNMELIAVGGVSNYFTPPEKIDNSLKNLINIIFKNSDIKEINKIIIFIFYFWKIHPFNDGNGTIAEILYLVLMFKKGYTLRDLKFKEYFLDRETKLFYDKDKVNFYNLFEDYYSFLLKKDS